MNIITTWEHIAEALDRSVRTAKHYAALPVDPMPVKHEDISGRAWITVKELCEWAHSRSLAVSICVTRQEQASSEKQEATAGKEERDK